MSKQKVSTLENCPRRQISPYWWKRLSAATTCGLQVKVTKFAPSSLQIRRRPPQVGAQVRHIWLDELRWDGWHVQSLIGCESVAATEGVVIVSTFSTCDPQHINRRDDCWVFGVLKVHRNSLLGGTTNEYRLNRRNKCAIAADAAVVVLQVGLEGKTAGGGWKHADSLASKRTPMYK